MSASGPLTRDTLLHRVADGANAPAWEEFYALYAPLLFRYVRARGLGPDDAEEVRDQCLGALAAKLPRFRYDRERGRFRGFLKRMADDRVVDMLRRRRPAAAESATLAGLADPGPSPEELWEARWREQALLFHLEAVCRSSSARDERVLRMLLFDSASAESVAEVLSLEVANVHQIKSRMLRKIRERCRD